MTSSIVAPDPMQLVQLRQHKGVIYAENVVFKPISVREPERKVNFSIGPSGRSDSIIVLPPRALDVPGFRRIVQRGEVVLSTDVELMEGKMAILAGDLSVLEGQRREELLAMIDPNSTSKDMIQVECQVSHELIFQNAEEYRQGVVPLAPQYKHLAYQFISSKSDDGKFTYTRIQT